MQDYLGIEAGIKTVKREYQKIAVLGMIVAFILGMLVSAALHEWMYHG